jgi:diguanylate cyclase (GGDEF)-like protein
VISLKKYLDLDPSELKKHIDEADPVELFSSTLDSYRSTLAVIGACCVQVCPSLGRDLQLSLARISERLSKKITPPAVKEIEQRVEEQLQQWGGRSAEYFKNKTSEVKEILIVLARTAESAADRDQRHSGQFIEFTTRLESIADLEDLTQIRSSILQSANELKICVDKMAKDNRDSVAQLRSQVTVYQTKLEEVEQRTSRDAVTGLDTRRSIEAKIERRIAEKQTFCLVMFDLNGFKQVNDTHGHLAGDDLLKQFATEMRSASRATDIIGRWGGDEFVVILDCRFNEAQTHLERMQKWVFGDYEIQSSAGSTKVQMSASVGLTECLKGETLKDLIGRADAAMYQEKAKNKKKK